MLANLFSYRSAIIQAAATFFSTAGHAQQPPGIHDPDAVVTAVPGPPTATQRGGGIVLDFEGLADGESVSEFYNGGTGGSGSGPGANFGISFSTNSVAFIDADAGGSGNFGGEPSPDTAMSFVSGTAATMNVAAGFTNGFSFFYSAINSPGQITVYDGLNATGNVLATLNLSLTPANGAPDPTGAFSPLVPIGVTFTGTARSVDFGGTVDQVGFDNITLGSGTPGGGVPPQATQPVPSLSLLGLLLLAALVAMIAVAKFRRRGM